MLNVHELERRWLVYRLKRLIPYIVTLFTATAAALAVLFWSYGDIKNDTSGSTEAAVERIAVAAVKKPEPAAPESPEPPALPEQKSPVEKHKADLQTLTPEQNAPIDTPVPVAQPLQQQKEEPVNVLKPSFGFIHSIEEEIVSYHETPRPKKSTTVKTAEADVIPVKRKIKKAEPKPPPAKTKKEVQKTEQVKSTRTAVAKQPSNRQVLIRHQDDDKDVQDVIKRFKKNKNPALSLFVAKKYYAMGIYDQAYNYALITNELDNEIEDSWLIFSKSLVKLGKKEMAVKTLRSYINKTNSIKAKILLDDISKGTFE